MTKLLAGIAGLGLIGLAAMPVTATAAERQSGVATKSDVTQSTDISAQRRHWRHRHYGYRHYGPRRFYGPRYGYYRPYPYYGGYGYPYYARPYYSPGVAFGFGPFGLRVF